MPNFENKIIEVCSECGTAACWYGEFMCTGAKSANVELKTVKELRESHLEHETYWSDELMTKVYGEPAPHGYRSDL